MQTCFEYDVRWRSAEVISMYKSELTAEEQVTNHKTDANNL